MDEDAMKLKYKKCKYKVKKWESEFRSKNGVNPSKVNKLLLNVTKSSYYLFKLFIKE